MQHRRFDILGELLDCGHESLVLTVLELLDSLDLKACELVSRLWQRTVRRLWDHHEFRRVGRGWSSGQPTVETIAVRKERSVCTVTSIATDDTAIACALGSSGKVELWDRRKSRRVNSFVARIAFLIYMPSVHVLRPFD